MSDATMTDGQEGQWYGLVAAASGAGAIASYLFGFLTKGWGRAEQEGRWRASLEAQVKSLEVQLAASEARMTVRVASIEARHERIDERISTVPSRNEMQDRFDRLEEKINNLSSFLHRPRPSAAE